MSKTKHLNISYSKKINERYGIRVPKNTITYALHLMGAMKMAPLMINMQKELKDYIDLSVVAIKPHIAETLRNSKFEMIRNI